MKFNQFTKLNLLAFFWAFLVIQAVIFPLFFDSGLSQSEAFLVMGVFAITMAILDVPAGYLSDLIGRRKTLILAAIFKGVGGTVLLFVRDFQGFVSAYVLIGIANSLLSGTDLALLYETHAQEKDPPAVFDLLAMRNLYSKYGTALSSLLGGMLAGFGYGIPLILNSLFAWSCLAVALSLQEPRTNQSTESRQKINRKSLAEVFAETHHRRVLIAALIGLSLILMAAQWGFQRFWKHQNVSFTMMGILWAAYSLMGGHAVKFSVRLLGQEPVRLIFSSLLLAAFGLFGAGYFNGPASWISCLLVPIGLSPALVQLRHLLNDGLNGRWRATLNSIDSFLTRTLFFFASPILGKVLDQYGFQPSFLTAGLGLFAFVLVSGIFTIARPVGAK